MRCFDAFSIDRETVFATTIPDHIAARLVEGLVQEGRTSQAAAALESEARAQEPKLDLPCRLSA